MRRTCLLFIAPLLISGCSSLALPRAADAQSVGAASPEVRIVNTSEREPVMVRASTRPRGLMPCGDSAALTDACRRPGDVHGDVVRRLAPTTGRRGHIEAACVDDGTGRCAHAGDRHSDVVLVSASDGE